MSDRQQTAEHNWLTNQLHKRYGEQGQILQGMPRSGPLAPLQKSWLDWLKTGRPGLTV